MNEKTKEKLKDRTDKEKARLKEVIQRTSGKAGASGKDKKLAKIQVYILSFLLSLPPCFLRSTGT